ncbi:MFS transporter [Trebonia sp.]|uniref:MFS transporter n=1 Tax=Trebonia sp. TaxID=2767075 RepID=UPI0026026799|nr:MFS transporter [Trebonia sp.]
MPSVAALLREPARPAAVRRQRMAPWFAVGTVCFGAFMGQLDASVVTVAFPALQRQFHAGLAGVQWVSLGYLLALVALLVPAGRWSDRAGRKVSYLYGFVVFAGASAACGLASSLAMLIGLRLVQAAGAAMLQSNSVALVVTSVPGPSRRAALGVQAAAQAVGLASGPVTGGLLIAAAGWRWIFLMNVPVGLVGVVAGWYLLPRTRQRAARGGTDPGGMVLLATTAAAAMLAISSLSGLGVPAWALAGCAAIAVAAGAGLWRWERRSAAPLLDLRALATAGIAPALGGALCAYLVLFGPLVLFPQVIIDHGGSALDAGLLLTSLPAGFGAAAVASDRLLPKRWPNRRRCSAGGLLAAGCAAALAVPAPHAVSVVLLGLLGVGLGVYTPANNAEIMAALPAREAATGGGMVNMTRGIGTALGVAVVTLGLHTGTLLADRSAGPALALAALAAAALAAAWAGSHAVRAPAPGATGSGQPAGTDGQR